LPATGWGTGTSPWASPNFPADPRRPSVNPALVGRLLPGPGAARTRPCFREWSGVSNRSCFGRGRRGVGRLGRNARLRQAGFRDGSGRVLSSNPTTRKVDDVVRALGVASGISESEVSDGVRLRAAATALNGLQMSGTDGFVCRSAVRPLRPSARAVVRWPQRCPPARRSPRSRRVTVPTQLIAACP
jgi:hypothetical protein